MMDMHLHTSIYTAIQVKDVLYFKKYGIVLTVQSDGLSGLKGNFNS